MRVADIPRSEFEHVLAAATGHRAGGDIFVTLQFKYQLDRMLHRPPEAGRGVHGKREFNNRPPPPAGLPQSSFRRPARPASSLACCVPRRAAAQYHGNR